MIKSKAVTPLFVSAILFGTVACGDSSASGGAGGTTTSSVTATTGAGSTTSSKSSSGTAGSTTTTTTTTTTTSTGGGGPVLTVNNTSQWCTVKVTVGNGAPVTFTATTMDFNAASGTTVTLNAVPIPPFLAAKWTGVTTMNGPDATYVMTGAATQSVTACCPLPNGTGC